jgi:hypothetical protein
MMLHLRIDHSLRSATPHTPKGVVVEQKQRSACSTPAPPQVERWSSPSTILFAGEPGALR